MHKYDVAFAIKQCFIIKAVLIFRCWQILSIETGKQMVENVFKLWRARFVCFTVVIEYLPCE